MSEITPEDIRSVWPGYAVDFLADILNGTYSLEEAKEDILSLIGSQYDPRTEPVDGIGQKCHKSGTSAIEGIDSQRKNEVDEPDNKPDNGEVAR